MKLLSTALSVVKETMTSLEVAEVTGKRHDSVLRDIRNLLQQGVDAHNFVETFYIDNSNRQKKCYQLSKKGCLILASGYNALLREKIINRWEELETNNTKPKFPLLSDKIMAAEFFAKFLNLNAASRLLMARRIGETVGMQDTLPTAIDAGTQHPVTQTATELLRRHNIKISTVAFNRILERKGIVKKASRPSNVKGKTHTWMVLQPDFDKYGENQQDPKHQKQTQIRWYEERFGDILAAAGLARQAAMSL